MISESEIPESATFPVPAIWSFPTRAARNATIPPAPAAVHCLPGNPPRPDPTRPRHQRSRPAATGSDARPISRLRQRLGEWPADSTRCILKIFSTPTYSAYNIMFLRIAPYIILLLWFSDLNSGSMHISSFLLTAARGVLRMSWATRSYSQHSPRRVAVLVLLPVPVPAACQRPVSGIQTWGPHDN